MYEFLREDENPWWERQGSKLTADLDFDEEK